MSGKAVRETLGLPQLLILPPLVAAAGVMEIV